MRRFTSLYGQGPLHAVLMLGCFAFAGYLVSIILNAYQPLWIVVWFVGAIVAHDFVLFPLYSILDRTFVGRRVGNKEPAIPWRNHVRVPFVISGTLLLVSFPLVLRLSEPGYVRATGLHTSVYLGRFLLIAGCIFGASALLYVARRARLSALQRAEVRRADREARAARAAAAAEATREAGRGAGPET
jgi:hypothetical protein